MILYVTTLCWLLKWSGLWILKSTSNSQVRFGSTCQVSTSPFIIPDDLSVPAATLTLLHLLMFTCREVKRPQVQSKAPAVRHTNPFLTVLPDGIIGGSTPGNQLASLHWPNKLLRVFRLGLQLAILQSQSQSQSQAHTDGSSSHSFR